MNAHMIHYWPYLKADSAQIRARQKRKCERPAEVPLHAVNNELTQ